MVHQSSPTVEFCWEKIEGNLKRANTEPSMDFRRANTEPSFPPLLLRLTQNADSVDLKGGLLYCRACKVKFPVVESYFSFNTTHTEVPSTKMDMEVW